MPTAKTTKTSPAKPKAPDRAAHDRVTSTLGMPVSEREREKVERDAGPGGFAPYMRGLCGLKPRRRGRPKADRK